ncbi:ABC transporter permease [Alkalibacterium pelagium]|uniref:ABC transporter permease n=1 Tax=Alkalibacterium pelagium TaxID=426702 RepID=UPI001FE8B6A5|nr:ABC transporter permease subunit [Alkalibacterium pelagium]
MAKNETKSAKKTKNKTTDSKTQNGFLKEIRKNYQLWLMILPGFLVILIFNYIPMYGLQLAFRRFVPTEGITGGEFVGMQYFNQFFDSRMFSTLMINTIRISATTMVVGFIAPVLLALLINQIKHKRAKSIMQTTVYLPHFISIVVMVGMLTVFLSPQSGILNHFADMLGFPRRDFLGSTRFFVPTYVISEIWQRAGWNSIIYLAALSNVDPQLYESARMDGANRWQLVRHVEIPSLVPTMIILFILNMGGILNAGFEKIFLMQNPLNLPVAEVISTYVYKIGIIQNQFSYATAIGLFNTLINFGFLLLANYISKKVAKTSLF